MIKSLSIIFPLYNESKRLQNAFKDIEKFQKNKLVNKVEYIFVDDGSKDNSSKKIRNYLKKKKFFNYKIIKYKKNFGKGYAIKKGILAAKNEWILTIDIDISVSLVQLNNWIKKKIHKKKYLYLFWIKKLKRFKYQV